ncbi:SDR family NAD(P)-dependent oxidoreductase [Helicobacter rodentium]|nr:SDR family NAD(P)-dependent oxidoreductase [Helicobacter rodentium]
MEHFMHCNIFKTREIERIQEANLVPISSIAALIALPNVPSYSASKSFVKSLGESLSLKQQDVLITTICPGFIKTPLTDYLHQGIPQMSVQKASKNP